MEASDAPPLVVDLDGTLTPTDTLLESVVRLIRSRPLQALALPFALVRGRAAFKAYVASKVDFSPEQLPYRSELVEFLRSEKERGRRIVLATASHRDVAQAIASHLGVFDAVIATDGLRNLKGVNKLEAIRQSVGNRFVYAGDSRADLPVWRAADAAILAASSPRVASAVRRDTPIEREFAREHASARHWLRELRVHQWVKNLLLFVPLLTAVPMLDAHRVLTLVLAFVAFCTAASASYIFNDLWDLDNDRAHPRKRERPLASGRIQILHALLVAGGGLVLACALAAAVSQGFLFMLLSYLVLTSLYSWVLKERVLLDVLTLSLLYTLRIVAGCVAVGVAATSWLLAFSVFIFFSLALVKRCAELVSLAQAGAGATRGRDYLVSDLVVLWPLGVGAALCAVVVFGLFISDADTLARYSSPRLLWLVAIGLIYWLGRLWITSARGQMHDDPVVFAIRDATSRLTLLAMVAATLLARFATSPGL
jgi:4-hydroxybenzoate polyprenyltransferase/phosphoserine phosphatase